MIVYEVNLTVDQSIRDDYLVWLRHHVDEMLAIEGFETAELLEIDEVPEGTNGFCCQYRLADRAALDHYMEHHAERMRADGQQRFGGRFTASRRILESL